jgi:hypothetical protein
LKHLLTILAALIIGFVQLDVAPIVNSYLLQSTLTEDEKSVKEKETEKEEKENEGEEKDAEKFTTKTKYAAINPLHFFGSNCNKPAFALSTHFKATHFGKGLYRPPISA